ncbi:hypothetical protein [Brevibacillus agri]|nr:hypothetical protein [Brevibacillus agri]MDN4091803.1 hypothetical protein [Brevibacillus agri]MDR9503185.1 hypothetical protein [Brevibacillus agri]
MSTQNGTRLTLGLIEIKLKSTACCSRQSWCKSTATPSSHWAP